MKSVYLLFLPVMLPFVWEINLERKPIENDMDKIILVSTILNIPSDQAFDYFTKNELLEKWLTAKAIVEPFVGGKYELYWTPNDPDKTNNSTYGCRVLAIDPPHYFNIEWKGNADQKEFMNNIRPLTNVTVIFSAIGENRTKVSLLHSGWKEGDNWEAARQYFTKSWSMALNKLEKIVNKV